MKRFIIAAALFVASPALAAVTTLQWGVDRTTSPWTTCMYDANNVCQGAFTLPSTGGGVLLPPAQGGTGVNNGLSTMTIGANFTMSGAFTFTGVLTGVTNVTFPTSGTLATTAGTVASVGNYAADSTLMITGTGSGPWTGAVTVKCTVSTASQIGCSKPDGTIITDVAGTITVPKATSGIFGVVEPDGTIITVTGGAITVAKTTVSTFGVVEVGTNLNVTAGVISSPTATAATLGSSSPDNVTIKAVAGVYTDQYPTSGDLMLSAGNGAVPTAYGGASCTNQVITALSVAGATTCASVTNAFLTAGTFSNITGVGTLGAGTAGTGFTIAGVTMALGSDATGDIYYRNSSGVLTRLGIGGSGNALTVVGGLPQWAAISGIVTSVFTRSGAVVAAVGDYNTAQITTTTSGSAPGAGVIGQTISATGTTTQTTSAAQQTTVSLTAGSWRCSGIVYASYSSGTAGPILHGWIQTSATPSDPGPPNAGGYGFAFYNAAGAASISAVVGDFVVNFSSTTSVYLDNLVIGVTSITAGGGYLQCLRTS